MLAKYKDISTLSKKVSVDGSERIPVSKNEYVTIEQINSDIPALTWKVADGMLWVKPAGDLDAPILKHCLVGILHYKNAGYRYVRDSVTNQIRHRPSNQGYKLVQDSSSGGSITWTSVRIDPHPYDLEAAALHGGWMPVISVENLFARWVEKKNSAAATGGKSYVIHRGSKATEKLDFGPDESGKTRQKATIYCGVVLFIPGTIRAEGPRSYFKVFEANYGVDSPSVGHL